MTGSRYPKTALVTGASTGIGAEFARALAERGYSLVLVARRADLMTDLGDELRDRFGVPVRSLPADLTGPTGLAKIEERLRADGSGADAPIDLLVNNAGRASGDVGFARQEADDIDAMLDLNIRAVVNLARAVLPVQLARRASGVLARRPLGVINVSSLAGELPVSPTGALYAASKAFVTRWSENVAADVASHNVQVTAVLAGFVRTEMTQEADLPDLAFTPKERVVRDALRAWAAGRSSVVPGVRYKAAGSLLRLVPRPVFQVFARGQG